ncbi:Uncharacterized protein Fot_06765 [Forsythia ovata]|uniref:Uncharacterized protein n=1 Tax=Forsythia ovata TaxID=205694 RepID=A0ABD1WU84_9LAMI
MKSYTNIFIYIYQSIFILLTSKLEHNAWAIEQLKKNLCHHTTSEEFFNIKEELLDLCKSIRLYCQSICFITTEAILELWVHTSAANTLQLRSARTTKTSEIKPGLSLPDNSMVVCFAADWTPTDLAKDQKLRPLGPSDCTII